MAGDKVKQAFVDTLKGKPVARDKFGTIIGQGDYVVFGTGSQAASDLNFGRVLKVNYGKDKWGENKGKEIVSSVTVRTIEKSNSWRISQAKKNGKTVVERNGWCAADRRRAFQRFETCWVTNDVPDFVKELLDDYE